MPDATRPDTTTNGRTSIAWPLGTSRAEGEGVRIDEGAFSETDRGDHVLPAGEPQPPWGGADSSGAMIEREAFHSQVDDALVRRCYEYARWCLFYYKVPGGDPLAEELAQGTLTDILGQRIAWDSERALLIDQATSVIRYRVRDAKRSLERSGGPVEQFGDADGFEADPEVCSPEVALCRKQGEQVARGIVDELTALAADDDAARLVIMCAREGITERADVCAETGLSVEAYRNARRRLARLKDQLAEEQRARAMEVVA